MFPLEIIFNDYNYATVNTVPEMVAVLTELKENIGEIRFDRIELDNGQLIVYVKD